MEHSDELIERITAQYDCEAGMLIPMLQDLQAECGYLPAEHLRRLAKKIKIPLMRVFSVATFYSSFRLAPKGQHEVTLCMGTVCFLKGAGKISERICKEFKVEPGGTTPDRRFTFLATNCVGACALAPLMVVDGEYYDGVTPESAVKILSELSANDDAPRKESKKESKK